MFTKHITWKTPQINTYDIYKDMLKQPHLLIAGATGSGKSVLINALIYSGLDHYPIDTENGMQLILIDPKRVELIDFTALPHTLKYASEPMQILDALRYAMDLCEHRYRIMQKQRIKKYKGSHIYIVIDEFADLVTVQGDKVKPLIQRIAQIGRAARIHIILATQTPIAKIIPTEIKCNFDARVGLRTRSAQDSRNILEIKGCELLPRYGQMYYRTPAGMNLYPMPMIPENIVTAAVKFWADQAQGKKSINLDTIKLKLFKRAYR